MIRTNGMGAVALMAIGGANAQPAQTDQLQIYGVVDAGVEYVTNAGPYGGGVTRMNALSGGQLPSLWGVRGGEMLGRSLRAVFALEAGFAIDSGERLQGGRSFGRQSYVGLQGDWGAITFGRHWTMTYFSILEANVMGPSVFGLAAFDPYLPNARTDNSVSYIGTFKGFTVGATYSFGRDVAAPINCSGERRPQECRAWSAMLKYDGPRWGASLAWDRLKGGASGNFFGQPIGTVASEDNEDTRIHINGYWRIGEAKVAGGLIRRQFKAIPTPLDTRLFYMGVSVPVAGVFSIDAQLIGLRDGRPGTNANAIVARVNYALSRRTSTYAMLGQVRNGRNAAYSVTAAKMASVAPPAGTSQTGIMFGVRHIF